MRIAKSFGKGKDLKIIVEVGKEWDKLLRPSSRRAISSNVKRINVYDTISERLAGISL
jgi:hypothetical protein